MSNTLKPMLKSVLIFGASGHIGGPLASFLLRQRPELKLRLATSVPEKQESLRRVFPSAEIVVANFFDLPSLEAATEGIEGAFLVTTSGTNEKEAMGNVVTAFKKWGVVTHIVRLVGVFPELNPRLIPASLRGGGSLPVQHPIAKAILDESGLPVTYINSGASFLDNMFLQIKSVQVEKKFIWPEHRVPFIDPRDVAEVAGQLLLSENAKHIGQFHTMNNGTDWLEFQEVSRLLGEILGREIQYDGSRESFLRFYGPFMSEDVATLMWEFFKFEQANEVCWALNNFVERTIGRKPITMREWLVEHRNDLLQGL